jgi:antitoxin component of RelBE/YafQ-DinJ toxin-antitoxin module
LSIQSNIFFMKTAIITIKTEPELKRRAEEFAVGTGMSLSDVVNFSLRHTITTGRIVIEKALMPNAKTSKKLRDALNDIKAGKNLSPVFGSAAKMDAYLDNL